MNKVSFHRVNVPKIEEVVLKKKKKNLVLMRKLCSPKITVKNSKDLRSNHNPTEINLACHAGHFQETAVIHS